MIKPLPLLLVLAACGGDGAAEPDATPPPTVLEGLRANGPWMEDVVWGANSYQPCNGCQELAVIEFSDDGYDISVYLRDAGESATLGCSATFTGTEETVDGFEPSERMASTLTLGDNDCSWTDAGPWPTYVYAVLERDGDGAPIRVAGWPKADDDDDTMFPGYINGAAPLVVCPSAPGTLCEPSCTGDPAACGFDEPTP